MSEAGSEARLALQSLGISVSSSWGWNAEQTARGAEQGWQGASIDRKLDLLIAIFLESDLNDTGEGTLPPNVEVRY